MHGSNKQPHYLNYGYTQPGEESLLEKLSANSTAIMSFVLVIILISSTVLGIYFGLSQSVIDIRRPENHILGKAIIPNWLTSLKLTLWPRF